MKGLLPYYERELTFLRQYSHDFADRYPKIAAGLAVPSEQSTDPHVDRMIDAFALLGARVGKKLEDEFPELAEALFEVMYPHYLRPFPSCSIAQFDLPGARLPGEPATIARGTELLSREVAGVPCRFRTAYDVTLAPIRIACAQCRPIAALAGRAPLLPATASAVVSFTFETTAPDGDLAATGLCALRAYLHGEQSFIAALADCLFTRAVQAYVEADDQAPCVQLPSVPLTQVGVGEHEALVDYPAKSHPAFRLLSEYFAFPEKFNFVDFDLEAMLRSHTRCRRLTLHVVLAQARGDTQATRLVEALSAHHLRLFCTPVVNLFSRPAEPIRISHEAVSYPVVADAKHAHAYEIYSIDAVDVVKERGRARTVTAFHPFHGLRHDDEQGGGHYWFARRDASVAERSPGYETELSFVDSTLAPSEAQTDTASLSVTCTNRDWPARLAIGSAGGDLFIEDGVGGEPVALLCRPTPTARIGRGAPMHWRLVSHLALNHVSLAGSELDALKELLTLHDMRRTTVSVRHIDGLAGIERRLAWHSVPGEPYASFVRGVEIRLTVEEANFVGTSLASFVHVLDTFFGLYVNLNSFVQLAVISKRTGEEIMRCKPRSAESMLA